MSYLAVLIHLRDVHLWQITDEDIDGYIHGFSLVRSESRKYAIGSHIKEHQRRGGIMGLVPHTHGRVK